MAHNARFSDEARNAKGDALVALLDDGYLRIYDDANPQPSDPDTAVPGGTTLLAELRFANPAAAGAASGGVVTLDDIVSDTSINADGTALWFRAFKSDGTSPIMDGSVGAGGVYDLVFNSVNFVTAAQCDVTAFTYTEPTS
jgi:hypothetical protein